MFSRHCRLRRTKNHLSRNVRAFAVATKDLKSPTPKIRVPDSSLCLHENDVHQVICTYVNTRHGSTKKSEKKHTKFHPRQLLHSWCWYKHLKTSLAGIHNRMGLNLTRERVVISNIISSTPALPLGIDTPRHRSSTPKRYGQLETVPSNTACCACGSPDRATAFAQKQPRGQRANSPFSFQTNRRENVEVPRKQGTPSAMAASDACVIWKRSPPE